LEELGSKHGRAGKSGLTFVLQLSLDIKHIISLSLSVGLGLLGSVEEGVFFVVVEDFLLDCTLGLGFRLGGNFELGDFGALRLDVERHFVVLDFGIGLELLLIFVDDLLLGRGALPLRGRGGLGVLGVITGRLNSL
jgi:hypothetical protein